jgi:hypothetical protein
MLPLVLVQFDVVRLAAVGTAGRMIPSSVQTWQSDSHTSRDKTEIVPEMLHVIFTKS